MYSDAETELNFSGEKSTSKATLKHMFDDDDVDKCTPKTPFSALPNVHITLDFGRIKLNSHHERSDSRQLYGEREYEKGYGNLSQDHGVSQTQNDSGYDGRQYCRSIMFYGDRYGMNRQSYGNAQEDNCQRRCSGQENDYREDVDREHSRFKGSYAKQDCGQNHNENGRQHYMYNKSNSRSDFPRELFNVRSDSSQCYGSLSGFTNDNNAQNYIDVSEDQSVGPSSVPKLPANADYVNDDESPEPWLSIQTRFSGQPMSKPSLCFQSGSPRSAQDDRLYCKVCQISVNRLELMDFHLKGKHHLQKLKHFGLDATTPIDEAAEIIQKFLEDPKIIRYRTKSGAFYCDLCNMEMNHLKALYLHLEGTPHAKREQFVYGRFLNSNPLMDKSTECTRPGSDDLLHCNICNVGVTSLKNMYSHLNGTPHARTLMSYGINVAAKNEHKSDVICSTLASKPIQPEENSTDSCLYCKVCKISVNSLKIMEGHLKGKLHIRKLKQIGLDSTVPTELEAQVTAKSWEDPVVDSYLTVPTELEAQVTAKSSEDPVVDSYRTVPTDLAAQVTAKSSKDPVVDSYRPAEWAFYCNYCEVKLDRIDALRLHVNEWKHKILMAQQNAENVSSLATLAGENNQ